MANNSIANINLVHVYLACIFDSRPDCSLNGSLQGKPHSLIRHVHPDISQVWNMFGFWLSRLTLPLLAWWSPKPGSDVEDFPSLCLHSKTLERVTECLEEFIVPRGFYDRVSYDAAQPDISQRASWSSVISSLLHVDGNCSTIQVPDSLKGIYDVVTFTENTGASFCVFFELIADCHAYRKGWGAMIVPARREAVSRNVQSRLRIPDLMLEHLHRRRTFSRRLVQRVSSWRGGLARRF